MVGKKLKMAKRILCLCFVFLLSINSLAAIVSDNDGSAFVTKAEFESLKKDFADQVTNYETSLDKKIDGAIAAYLAGIKVEKKNNVKLTSEINVKAGSGYRSRSASDYSLTNAMKNTAEWVLGNATVVCYRGDGGWKNISTGELHGIYINNSLSNQTWNKTTMGATPWYAKEFNDRKELLNGSRVQVPHGVSTFSGSAASKYTSVPIIYVDKNGAVQEFSNMRPLVIDMRAARGANGATAADRWLYYAGVDIGSKPTKKIMKINELISDLPIKCHNDQDPNGADGFGYVYVIKKSASVTYNPNIFCWNPTTLCTAFNSECKEVLVWGQADTVAMSTEYSVSSTVNRLVWGGAATGGTGFNTKKAAMPYITFMPNAADTNLPNDAFETVTNYDYKRMKTKYLQLKDFKSVTDGTRNLYIYEGLPLYTAERNAVLSFNIKITKEKKETTDTNKVVLWDDPSDRMKIRIKNKPFNLNDDYSECIKIKIGKEESKEGSVTADTLTNVSFAVEKGKTYYMQWYCDGYGYGGEITYLSDGVEIVAD